MYWLPGSQQISYKIAALVLFSHRKYPVLLVYDLISRRALRSSARGELLVHRVGSALKHSRAFSVFSPSDGSRHSARGTNLICFPVSHVYFSLEGAKVYCQTGWEPCPDLKLD